MQEYQILNNLCEGLYINLLSVYPNTNFIIIFLGYNLWIYKRYFFFIKNLQLLQSITDGNDKSNCGTCLLNILF